MGGVSRGRGGQDKCCSAHQWSTRYTRVDRWRPSVVHPADSRLLSSWPVWIFSSWRKKREVRVSYNPKKTGRSQNSKTQTQRESARKDTAALRAEDR